MYCVYLTANYIILHFCNKHIRSHCTAVPLYKSNIYNVNHFSKNSAPIKYIYLAVYKINLFVMMTS